MSNGDPNITRLGVTNIAVPPGATQAIWFGPPLPAVSTIEFKYRSGGSLEITPDNAGSTWAAASLAPFIGTGRMLATSGEVVSVRGPATFYLMATGATAVCTMQIGFNSNSPGVGV